MSSIGSYCLRSANARLDDRQAHTGNDSALGQTLDCPQRGRVARLALRALLWGKRRDEQRTVRSFQCAGHRCPTERADGVLR